MRSVMTVFESVTGSSGVGSRAGTTMCALMIAGTPAAIAELGIRRRGERHLPRKDRRPLVDTDDRAALLIDLEEERQRLRVTRDLIEVGDKLREAGRVGEILGVEDHAADAAVADHRLQRGRDLRAVKRDAHELPDLALERHRSDYVAA